MKQQKGFTLVELVTVISLLVYVAILGTIGYVAWHFIAKYW